MKHEEDGSRPRRRNDACPCPDCRLPPQGPPAWLRDKAVPIWCGPYYAELATEMGQDAAGELEASEFAVTVSRGLAMAASFGSASGMVPVGSLRPLPFFAVPPSLVAKPLLPGLVSGALC